jgi:hypothetical protein
VPVSLEGQDGDGVGALLLTDGGHAEESIPQGLKPLFSWGVGRAKPEGLAYLEACSRFARMIHISGEKPPDMVHPRFCWVRQIWAIQLTKPLTLFLFVLDQDLFECTTCIDRAKIRPL